MGPLYTLFLGCLVILLLTGSSDADSEVKGSTLDPGLDRKKDVPTVNGSALSDGGSTDPDSDTKSKKLGKVENDRSTDKGKLGKQVVGDSGSTSGKGRDEKKDVKKLTDGVGATEDPKGSEKEGNEGTETPTRKEGPRVEECDLSNRCTAEKGKLVACLRLPGDDSPRLLLLIQNKGKGPLTVKISTPDSVELEQTKVHVKGKENHKVMVSVGKQGSQSSINLTAGSDSCSLDFRDMMLHSARTDFDGLTKSQSTKYLTRKPMTAFIVFAALFVLASVAAFITVRKKLLLSKDSKYQRLDMMELPVTNARKPESSDEGWDEGWGDGWDDEEVPSTPSKPVTPSVSSKGLAPRRATKEGWKD